MMLKLTFSLRLVENQWLHCRYDLCRNYVRSNYRSLRYLHVDGTILMPDSTAQL